MPLRRLIEPEQAQPASKPPMTTTILLVEDEATDVFFFERAMKKAGVVNPLQVATDGEQALDYLEGRGKFADRKAYPLPCLIVLDLKMPGTTGFEVLERIRHQPELRKLVVVVLTSSVSDEDIAKAYELGANAYLVKPADSTELVDVVEAIKHFWLTHNHAPPHTTRLR
jgi:two-component system response regulator